MFRLIKILNSGVNVPETVKLKKSATLDVKMGSAIVIVDGIVTLATPNAKPTHIALSDAGNGTTSIPCYPVFENMLFETTVNADPSALQVGSKVTISANSECVTSTTSSGVATVVELLGAKAAGDRITVKF